MSKRQFRKKLGISKLKMHDLRGIEAWFDSNCNKLPHPSAIRKMEEVLGLTRQELLQAADCDLGVLSKIKCKDMDWVYL